VEGPGLRARKKARTRRQIAEAAARLFAERGYERVTVTDVAREAEVAEQTVYNYFGTKERLVTDRDDQIQEHLCELIRARPAGTTPAAAVREYVLTFVDGARDTAPELWRGELGPLAAISPTVHRLALELVERQADALTVAIRDTSTVPAHIATLQAIGIASVFGVVIRETGRRTIAGATPSRIADEVGEIAGDLLAELDRWYGSAGGTTA
jgi:AcrR family transcriptional regulator